MLRNVFGVKYSRALGILEKYICTPEETHEWKRKNTEIMQLFEEDKKKKREKEDFVNSLFISGKAYPPYLPPKEFDTKFEKRKEEQEKKKQEPEDIIPF